MILAHVVVEENIKGAVWTQLIPTKIVLEIKVDQIFQRALGKRIRSSR